MQVNSSKYYRMVSRISNDTY